MLALLLAAPASALTCDEVFSLTTRGTPEAEVVARIKAGLDLTSDDLTCLDAGGASRAVLDAARWKLAHPTNPAPAPPPTPPPAGGPRVDVAFLGAVLAGAKADGSSWDLDSAGAAAAGVAATVGLVAVGGPAGPAAARLGQLGAGGLAAPDPAGFVELLPPTPAERGPTHRRVSLPGRRDTYRPTFDPPPRYRGFPLADLRFRVHLWDDDAEGRDPLPVLEISADDLRAALSAGGVVELPGVGPLVAVRVRVEPSSLSDRRVEGQDAR